MANYTTNIAQNPGFQLDISGYQAVNNAILSLGSVKESGALLGNPGLLVTTPGVLTGEGVSTFDSSTSGGSGSTYSFSIYIQGLILGNVTVYAIANPGGLILGSTPVTLTSDYQRVTLNGLNVGAATDLFLMVTTTSLQAVKFWITNVQIEPSATAHIYCDGGQSGCQWTGGIVGSTSFQPFQNTAVATASNFNASDIVNILVPGEAFNESPFGAFNVNNPNVPVQTFAGPPTGAMSDFSVSALTDLDPAQTYPSWNNAGISVPTTGYARVWGTFFPPQDYTASNNLVLFTRGAFMAAGFQFNNVPNNQKVIVTDVQVEVLPMTTGFGAPSPTTYMLPREIQSIIKPNRLNYCPNPSMETGITGWNPVGTAVLTQDGTTSVGTLVVIDDVQEGSQATSLNVTTTTDGDGASIVIPDLIAGDTYIASAYVQAAGSIADITMNIANGSTSVSHGNSGTGYGGPPGYGLGFYGGNPSAAGGAVNYGTGDYGSGVYGQGTTVFLNTGVWYRIFVTFTPTDSSATLTIAASQPSSGSNFWIDAVLVESGQVLDFYFDGDFGTNYFWETGGTKGATRSYFYDQFFVKSQAVNNILEHHTPLGISAATPLYSTPPTQ